MDLRIMASRAQEPERQRKLLTLAEQYEERDDKRASREDVGKGTEG